VFPSTPGKEKSGAGAPKSQTGVSVLTMVKRFLNVDSSLKTAVYQALPETFSANFRRKFAMLELNFLQVSHSKA
jgi:hypothetical protein